MINAQRTGAYISKLRKSKDWTQQELAEKLHVTHQAVSNWEKGDTYPDIAVLPELARVFHVSVDDLLNGEPGPRGGRVTAGSVVEELARGHPQDAARLVEQDPEEGIQAILEAAPLTKPSMMNQVMKNMENISFKLEHIVELAPFVAPDVLQSLLANITLDSIPGEAVCELAPFVGREALDSLITRVDEGALKLENLATLAPFIDPKTLRDRVLRQSDQEAMKPEHLEEMAPFLDKDTLEQLVARLAESAITIDFVTSLAPFASRATVDRLLNQFEEVPGEYLSELAPFVGRERLKTILMQQKGGLSPEEIVAIAPFLDRETLGDLIRGVKKE